MNKSINIFALICLLTLNTFKCNAQNMEWNIISSSVSFKIKNAGFTTDGKFGGLSGTILFDAAKGFGNSIDVSIDAKTVNTGNSTRDGHLNKKEYFDVDTYPKINMKATLFSKEKIDAFKGYFKLSLKNKTKDIPIQFTFNQNDGKGVFTGTFTINRLDYGIGESSMILSDNVTITININVIKK